MSTLFPLDLLSLSDNEQQVLRCLSKQPQLSMAEIAAETGIAVTELEALLPRMVAESRLVEQLKDEERVFSVRFGREQKQVRNLPRDLLDIFEQSPGDFLADVSITATLNDKEREALLQGCEKRVLVPNEVLVWQGEQLNQIGLVRNGLLKKSRLQGKRLPQQTTRYVHRAEWVGLNQSLNGAASLHTYTAVTDSELLLWPVDKFTAFMQQNPKLSTAVGQFLGQQLRTYEEKNVYGLGKLWVIEALESAAGATTVAANLAWLAAAQNQQPSARVILWPLRGNDQTFRSMMGLNAATEAVRLPGVGTVLVHESGLHILQKSEHKDYPAKVQVEILLTNLRERYDTIICDTGAGISDDALYLRSQGHALVTITSNVGQSSADQKRRQTLPPYTRPMQKRFLLLNRAKTQKNGMDFSKFHIVLPEDENTVEAKNAGKPMVALRPESDFSNALQVTYRRLLLSHTVSIFIPTKSTRDKHNSHVQSTLSFLTDTFGEGAQNETESIKHAQKSELVTEQVTIVRTFVSEAALESHLDEVFKFAAKLKEGIGGEAIAIDVDNQLILV